MEQQQRRVTKTVAGRHSNKIAVVEVADGGGEEGVEQQLIEEEEQYDDNTNDNPESGNENGDNDDEYEYDDKLVSQSDPHSGPAVVPSTEVAEVIRNAEETTTPTTPTKHEQEDSGESLHPYTTDLDVNDKGKSTFVRRRHNHPKIRKRTEFMTTTPSPTTKTTTTQSEEADFDDSHTNENTPIRYYRIVYRGVVALLSKPPKQSTNPSRSDQPSPYVSNFKTKKSGVYLSYGEIVASSQEIIVDMDDDDNDVDENDNDAYSGGDHNRRRGVDVSTPSNGEERSKINPATPQRNYPSQRLGSAVSSPILADIWERQQQQQEPPSSPRTSAAPSTYIEQNRNIETSSTMGTATKTTRRRRMVRVDQILTGGYAIDMTDLNGDPVGMQIVSDRHQSPKMIDVKSYEKTPKRGNMTHSMLLAVSQNAPSMIIRQRSTPGIDGNLSRMPGKLSEDELAERYGKEGFDPMPPAADRDCNRNDDAEMYHGHGYMFLEQRRLPIAVPITYEVPECKSGNFLYRVVSSTPIPVLTGPCQDAPKTKGILIPGSIHEVCLEVGSDDGSPGVFLRLMRRRGWVFSGKWSTTKRKNTAEGHSTPNQHQWVTTMKKLPPPGDIDGTSVASRVSTTTVSSAIATPISAARRRHRPPRRKQRDRITKDAIDAASLPRHVMGPAHRNDTSLLTDTSMTLSNTSVQQLNTDPRAIVSPASNISLLSDESSLEQQQKAHDASGAQPSTPDRSVARSTASSSLSNPSFFLIRVNAPRGLKILDAPHFQVNHLIHGTHGMSLAPSGGGGGGQGAHSTISPLKDTGNQSIFQTMTGQHHTTTMTSKLSNPAVFDSVTKSRRLPRGTVFEASKRMESGAYSQSAGLIKLSDNSGWAIVPRQDELDEQYRNYSGALANTREGEATRAYEEVGNALPEDPTRPAAPLFLRVLSKGGLPVSLPPIQSTESDVETSPTSSTAGSSAVGGAVRLVTGGGLTQVHSDVASSVASSFLDAFRTPRKNRDRDSSGTEGEGRKEINQKSRPPIGDRTIVPTVIPCGMCVEVERWADPLDTEQHTYKNEYARLRGGQGWVPRFISGRPVVETIPPPEVRFGSFWFRVQDQRGIKVRLGPSRRAPSIKSDDGVYFRFECGEFLRASEVVTIFRRSSSVECFAKLYRNRHIRLQTGLRGEARSLASLTTQAEWVQVFGDGSLFLDECATEPRIERHRQGWRYNVVLDARVAVRKGPSFEAETDGVFLLGGESILVNERVTGPDETITWLRLKDGLGWVHNIGRNGETLMIPHSLRHRASIGVTDRPTKVGRHGNGKSDREDIAYNTIVARLFHNDLPNESPHGLPSRRLGRQNEGI